MIRYNVLTGILVGIIGLGNIGCHPSVSINPIPVLVANVKPIKLSQQNFAKSDRDGVINNDNTCPNTSTEDIVNHYG